MKKPTMRFVLCLALCVGMVGAATPQIREILKVLGVGAVVQRFGGDINKAINGLTGHKDTNSSFTKVVPIISVGINTRRAIGAAQVMGTKTNVSKVKAVAAPEGELFGEVRIRALIPIATENPLDSKNLKAVDGVGVSGIVDLEL